MGSYLPQPNYHIVIRASRPHPNPSSAERFREIQLIRTDSLPKFINSFHHGGEPV